MGRTTCDRLPPQTIKDRANRRAALGDRKSAASQARMKNTPSLAADECVPKKRRKGGGGKLVVRFPRRVGTETGPSLEDMFGADDAEWAIYRKIVRVFRVNA